MLISVINLISKIINNFTDDFTKSIPFYSSINVLLDIVDPTVISFEVGIDVYILYLLDYDIVSGDCTFLLMRSDYGILDKIINGTEPLRSMFTQEMRELNLNLRESTTELVDITFDSADEQGYLPTKAFYLNEKYPNKVNLDDLKIKILIFKNNLKFKRKTFKKFYSKGIGNIRKVNNDYHYHEISNDWVSVSDADNDYDNFFDYRSTNRENSIKGYSVRP
ncbi:hypothetical protein [Convivina intestini]|uniref:Uncharacterized protein n=1 Tax=Convivina intestini TaxID=1505726 RepID=A0A2U1D4G4_9LACO|nr:hypothetical protein [Convivina intestini]PVY82565.1 hypothetical protein C7384_1112 [Convivina intestini]CAH1857309.1 hypothetical protein R077811_01470 [Convivina intestini]SDC10345.1 hypothetical protein SAMN05216341_11243 [Leuconostocaceae bacterium R-53105]